MGSQESLPNADPKANTISIKDQNLKQIPFVFPKDNTVHAIDFTGNQIESIPSNLTSLVSICLSKNNYSKIPKGVLDFMHKSRTLQYLDFSHNYLKEIPRQLQKMGTIKKVTFFNNLIEEVNNLPENLEGIELGQNLIKQFPIVSEKMERLSLNFNHITMIDKGSMNLTHLFINMNEILQVKPNIVFNRLTHLEISKNSIRNLPDLSKLTPCLVKLDASVNLIESFPNFPKTIKTINFAKNKITKIPISIKDLQNLENLSIEKNQLTHVPVLPSKLKNVLLSLNQITSVSQMRLPHVSNLTLMKNKLESQPPILESVFEEYLLFRNCITEIKLEYLPETITKLDFSDNSIESIPEDLFSKLPNLTCLHVFKNKLHHLPESISESKLAILNFSENPIDLFPQNLPPSLTSLYCGKCNLHELSIDLSILPNLKTVDASGNCLKSFDMKNNNTSFRNLFLSSNCIESFPMNLPSSIIVLDLSRNCITQIPENIIELNNLKDISFSYNNLSSIPSNEKFVFPSLFSLKVDHNPHLSFTFDVSQHPNIQNIDISCSNSVLLNESSQLREIILSKQLSDLSNHKFIPEAIDNFVGYSEMCGRRSKMEDSIVIRPNIYDDVDLYAIFDGHNGSETADYCSFHLPRYFDDKTKDEQIQKTLQFIKSSSPKYVGKNKSEHIHQKSNIPNDRFSEDYCKFVCQSLDESLGSMKFNNGSTLAMVLIKKNELIVSHIGDTRVLLISESGEIKHVTSDHKPQRQDELKRILDCGGKVVNGRLNGIIAMSRSLGDFEVVGLGNEPTITRIHLEKDDKWVIIACDGLFEVMTNVEVAAFATQITSAVEYSYLLRNIAHCRQSLDNISIISIDLFERFRLSE